MEIEEVAAESPDKIFTAHVDPAIGLPTFQVRRIAYRETQDKALVGQIECARNEDDGPTRDSCQAASDLLAQVKTLPTSALRRHVEQLARIRDLHDRLRLILSQQKGELDEKRRQMRQGRNVLQAYKGITPT